MDLTKWIRPEVRNFQPYLPGKPVEELRRDLGLKKIVKLASNENALGTSRKALSALRDSSKNVFRYPEGTGLLLRRAIAHQLKVNEGQVILGAGSDEIIELFGKTFFNREDEIIVSEHAFIRYQMAADLMGAKTIVVPMKDFKHDLERMAGKINSRTKALFIANPNNPTGTYVNSNEVRSFFSRLSELDIGGDRLPFVIFDEAYYEYSRFMAGDYPESLEYFRGNRNVVILRTFSKIHGLAGLRVGYGIAKEPVIEVLDRVRPPFNVSSVAQAAAAAALLDQGHVKKSVLIVKQGMAYLSKELKDLGFIILPSAGNFLMVDVSPWRGKDLFEKLLKKGVIIRAIDEYGFPNQVRVTVGNPKENRFFIQKLKEVLSAR